ncbi:MAG TPA: hypothetical protein VEX39_02205 [Thermoleophilaceae bacterium]|nr:hypothetical protein [Thermoleophilaceae bacterium]
MAQSGGQSFERERWVDLAEIDHRGFYYGVAESPSFIPLYGNGLVHIEHIDLECDAEPDGSREDPRSQDAERRLNVMKDALRAEHEEANRAFFDTPLVRLLSWQPPVSAATPLRIKAERVSHQTYAAATTLLRRDDGPLREDFEVTPRRFDNPIVRGALGVELAVITSDGKLVLGHRGDASTDYRRKIVVSFGEGIDPRFDAEPHDDRLLNPRLTVARGLKEEFGIEADGSSAVFLALGAELTRMDPDLLGYIRVPHTSSELQGSLLAGRARDRWETQTVTFIDFSPDSVADLLAGSLRGDLTPPTAMNLVFALSHLFGESETERAMAR